MHYFYLSNYLNYVILSWLVRHPQVVIWLSIVYSILAGGCPQSLLDIDCVCACVFAHLDVQLCLTHWNPMDGSPPPFLSIGILQARILEWLWCPPPGDLSNPGIKPRSPPLQVDSLPSEPPGKPKNTGVGSLSLLQWIFLAQESNQGLLHCRQIL